MSAVGMLIQAARTAHPPHLRNNWNALVIGLSYVSLAVISFGYYVKRTVAIQRKLSQIPRDYIPIREDDLPRAVYRHIKSEHMRTLAIAERSLPKTTFREGWGSPGTPFHGIRFRRALLDTVVPLDSAARHVIPHLPRLRPRVTMLDHFAPLIPLMPPEHEGSLQTYNAAIHQARYSTSEPTESEFIMGMRAAGQLGQLLDEYQQEMSERSTISATHDEGSLAISER
ncbi:hypothetical protein SISNIDRAFT_486057 [Sistotremastrum niveocremeum HHB9708]|uniref:Defect at low temperature protein 1 n=1 Tax=Sistotremastrum niveocremeum HHB9708 TaxID=1314777 RepID=A0A164UDB7_9AGAM|nr:hypothetical protein SISNIDRAFT_486057 [Sistotremastrum niveocremeum HHB9708]